MRTRYLGRRACTAAVVATIAAVTAISPAQADTDTGNLGVTATVVGTPPTTGSITTTPVAFGEYTNPNGGVVPGTGAVTVTVTSGAQYGIDLGTGSGGVGPQRAMHPTGAMGMNVSPLLYNLYADSSHSAVWGTDNGGLSVSGTGTGSAQSYTVYGEIQAQQVLTVLGDYTDTVVATVQF